MADSLTVLALDARLRAAITRLEALDARDRSGMAAGRFHARLALPRYLLWRVWLGRRIPTRASVEHLAHRLRGRAFAWLAAERRKRGEPLPRRVDAPPPVMETTTRAVGDAYSDWDLYGDGASLTVDELGQVRVALGAQIASGALAADLQALAYPNWLTGMFNDLTVLQVLDRFWNGQGTLWGGQDAFQQMGISGAFDLPSADIQAYLYRWSGHYITKIDETTRQQVAETLWRNLGGNAAGTGLGMDALARALQQSMDGYGNALAGMSRARARMIAVTETARAQTYGAFLAYQRLGVRQKEWLTTVGACAVCADNERQGAIPLQAQFPSGDQGPPGHPLCRCALTPVVPDQFDPTQWVPSAVGGADAAVNDPQYGYWPRIQRDDPYADQTPPPEHGADLALIGMRMLPASLQQVLTPQVLDELGARFGRTAQATFNVWAADAGLAEEATWAELDAADVADASYASLWDDPDVIVGE